MVEYTVPYTDISVCIFIILLFILFHKYGSVTRIVALMVVLGLFVMVYYRKTTDFSERTTEGMAQDTTQVLKKPVELVVARYNETLHWLNTEPFHKYPAVIYNKGGPMETNDFNTPVNVEILPNVGKCDHTYLYHIIKNYDNLADVTVFLPGSITMQNKIGKTKKIMSLLEENPNKTIFITNHIPNVGTALYNFSMEEYKTSSSINYLKNAESKTVLSNIRPFGKWFKHHFPDIIINHVSYYGIMAVSKKDIHQRPKTHYERLIKELETTSNPEVGHYFERAWLAIFYPHPEAIII